MTKLATTTLFTTAEPQKETALDKTTRIVRSMNEDDAERRHLKVARLRKNRFEKSAGEAVEAIATGANRTPNRR